MTNIFAKKPAPRKSALPTRVYKPWISIFEELVTEAQKRLENTRAMEKPYSVISDFLRLLDLPYETRINVGENYLSVWVYATEFTHSREIEDFNSRLAETLYNHSLRISKEPLSLRRGGASDWDIDCYYSLTIGKSLSTSWRIPPSGIADLEVETIRKEVTTYQTSYRLIPRRTPLPTRKVPS